MSQFKRKVDASDTARELLDEMTQVRDCCANMAGVLSRLGYDYKGFFPGLDFARAEKEVGVFVTHMHMFEHSEMLAPLKAGLSALNKALEKRCECGATFKAVGWPEETAFGPARRRWWCQGCRKEMGVDRSELELWEHDLKKRLI